MNWRNVRLIYAREIRDQLRDRRTLFMIAVLPLLLYPLLGMSVFQLSQFLRKAEPKVLVIGSEQVDSKSELPPLFRDSHFAVELFDDPADVEWLHVEFIETPVNGQSNGTTAGPDRKAVLESAKTRLKAGDVQVVLSFPPDFGDRLRQLRSQVMTRENDSRDSAKPDGEASTEPEKASDSPKPKLYFNAGKDKSRMAHMQVEQLLDAWKSQIVRENLRASRVPANVAKPFDLEPQDVAERQQQQALLWSKILPFVLFIWALTGAFYPAVDLCAGEKERGTLETLLSSPALRIEIVWGKLLTVMTFSGATALLNLTSLGFTARYVVSQLSLLPTREAVAGLEMPPLTSTLWLFVALVPMTALFSALCLACAAFARSTKEGQYYLMPLLLVSMPLIMLPMAPGTELNLGNSLIPVTGVVLLVMGLVQGNYAESIRYFIPVCVVTVVCCHWAIRWAVYQFNQESVLFRESERLDPRRWIVHLVRDRQDTPSLPEAFFCVALIFIIQFFTQLAISANVPEVPKFSDVVLLIFISQVVCFALPALLMSVLLTGRPLKTLLLDRVPNLVACGVAVLLALLLHPVGLQVGRWIVELYPVQQELMNPLQKFEQLLRSPPYPWLPYVLIALLPAICEELAFRGFILSGLRHLGSKWWAIGLAAVFFGMAHGVVQQSLSAAALGLVIGYLAVQTGSLIPCMLFHLTYNSLMFAASSLPELAENRPALRILYDTSEPGQFVYNWPVVAVCFVAALVPLVWLHQLPYQASKEESISDARARQPHHPLAASAPGSAD